MTNILKELKEMDAWVEKGDRIDVKTALNSLFRLENDALSSRDGYGYSSGDAEIIRKALYSVTALQEENKMLKTALEAAEKALMDCKIRLANNGIPEPETLDEALAEIKSHEERMK